MLCKMGEMKKSQDEIAMCRTMVESVSNVKLGNEGVRFVTKCGFL
jgi:hypothetical protein